MNDNLEQNMMEAIGRRHDQMADDAFFNVSEYPYDPAMLTLNPAGPEFAAGPAAAQALTPQPGAVERVTGQNLSEPSLVEQATGVINKGLSLATPFLQERHRPQIPDVSKIPGAHEALKGADAYAGSPGHVINTVLAPFVDQLAIPDEWKQALQEAIHLAGGAIMPGSLMAKGGAKAAEVASKAEGVTLFRGSKQGGKGSFWSPDESVAKAYAGESGRVLKETKNFSNLLTASTWMDAKQKLGLPKSATMPQLIEAARKAGHDAITFKGAHGPEYVVTEPK